MPILKASKVRRPTGPSALSTVILHGRLAEFGRDPIQLRAPTAAGVIRALCALKPGFELAFRDGNYRLIRGDFERGLDLDETMLTMRVAGSTLHILPVAEGAKNGAGIGKIVVGAVVVVASIFTYGAAAGWYGAAAGAGEAATEGAAGAGASFFGTTAFAGISYGQIAVFGAGLVLSGVASLLSPQPKKNTGSTTNSFGLSGRVNTTTEGAAIPVVYGQTLVGSTVVSVGYAAEDLLTQVPYDNGGGLEGGSSGGDPSGTGSGGGGKGGGSSSSGESANTIQSDSVVRIIDVLGEGQIGLINGAQSIYFNGTPLQAADGTYNFQGVNWDVRTGLPDQDPVSGYPAAEESVSYGVQVINGSGPLVQNVTSGTADAATVTIQIPALYSVDVNSGYISAGPDLSFTIEVQAVEGAWTTVVSTTFSGQKCTSPYERTYRFGLPGAGTGITSWNIRVTRLTADNYDTNIADDLYWESYSLITDHALIYPNTAYVALTIDAQSFGSQIPTRTYAVERLDVQVPANFDPVSRTYATSGVGTNGGTWDGVSWKTAVTDDPAWCLYDMLTNSRFGLALPTSVTELAAYELFTISQYANELVPDGFGGQEPRYTMNVVMASQTDAYSVLQNMVSAFRGMTYWGAGSVVVTCDMPGDPVSLVTQANVVNGQFEYEGSGLNTRHNVVRVTWIDPGNLYQPAVEVVEDISDVALRGFVPTDIVAFGCQSRGLANRLGKWLLYTEKYQSETLTFTAGMDQISVRPGMIFAQTDPSYAGVRMGGRIRPGATTTTIPLDFYQQDTGPTDAFFISCQLPDGTLANSVQIANFETLTDEKGTQYSVASLISALPEPPDPDAVFIVTSTSVSPRLWRCIGMTEPNRGMYQIIALSQYPGKYGYVEDGLALNNPNYSTLPALLVEPVPPPTNVTAQDYLAGVGTTTVIRVTVSWTAAIDPRVVSYQVQAQSASFSGIYPTGSVSIDIDSLPVGDYVFNVRSVGRDGRTSVWVSSSEINVDGISQGPDAPTGFTAVGGTRRIQLTWNAPPQRDILHYEVWRATSVTPPGYGATLLIAVAATGYTDNESDVLLPNTEWFYWVRAISTTLADGAFAGPVFAETTPLVADSIADGIVDTASFAQNITPVVLIPNIATQNGTYDGEIAYDETTAALYKWSSLSGAWQGVLNATTSAWFDSITAGIGSFGGLHSDQIAAGAIEATNLASTTLITESAQIGNLIVGTSNIDYNAATDTASSEAFDNIPSPDDGDFGEIISLAVTLPDSGKCVLFFRTTFLNPPDTSPPTDPEGGGAS